MCQQIFLTLPPEEAEVGDVILTQAHEQINGFLALLFEDSQKKTCVTGKITSTKQLTEDPWANWHRRFFEERIQETNLVCLALD